MSEYDAGSAFVAILPSTRGFAQRLKREMAGVRPGDLQVLVRPELDRRQLSGLHAALKALPAVVLDADASPADREIAALRARLEAIADKTVGIDISAADAKREVDSVRADLDRLSRESPDIAVRVDTGAASAALQEITTETTRLDGRTAKVKAQADTAQAQRSFVLLDMALSRLDGRKIAIQIAVHTALAMAHILAFQSVLTRLADREFWINVRANVGSAITGLAKVLAIVGALSTAIGGLVGIAGGLAGAIGGLGAAGVVAGAGIGATVLGFLGVGKAVGALSAQQESATSTSRASAKQQEQHARQVEAAYERVGDASKRVSQARAAASKSVQRAEADGEKSVAAARRQASASIASAVAARESADRRAARSTRDLRQAQSELTAAWDAGKRSLEDLQDQLDSSLLDQRQAAVDLKDARKALDEARASGDADAIERAQIAYDRQVESIDQLSKRTQRLQVDNTAAQKAGVAGTDQYRSALDRVAAATEQQAEASRAASAAAAAESTARIDGTRSVQEAELAAQQRIDDAREQGAQQVEAANEALIDSQRALTDALNQTGDAGAASGDKVAQAFAGLSPAAAAFARYLFGLKPILEGLSATAATALFPPLIAGIDTLLTRLPVINTVVGQLAGGMGAGLQLVLTQLASPFWVSFFTMLGDAAGTVIPMLFGSLMTLAGAAATLITALMPIVPASLAILDALSGWISQLAGPLVAALSGMFPAVHAFIDALGFLGPFLVALSPIVNALGVALAQILGATLQALTPILVALTPLFVQFAQVLAGQFIATLEALLPTLLAVATWMSEHPGLVIGVLTAIVGLGAALKPLGFLFGILIAWMARSVIFGTVAILLTKVGLAGTFVGRALLAVVSPFAALRAAMATLGGMAAQAGGLFALLRQAIMWIGRAILVALGPVGILIAAFGFLYASSEPFRNAVNGLLDVLMTLVGQLAGAVMPIFDALGQVFGMLAGMAGQLVGQLAAALVPVINVLAGTLSSLAGAILPPLMQVVGALVPVIMLLGAAFGEIVSAVVGPLIGAVMALVGAVLPPLVFLLQNVVVPVISFLARLFAGVLSWAISNVLVPAIRFLIPILVGLAGVLSQAIGWVVTNVVVPALNFLIPIFQAIGRAALWLWTNAIKPAWDAISAAAAWLWTNAIKPAFDAIVTIFKLVAAIVFTVLVAPLLIAWNLISAAAMWLWNNAIRPAFQAIGTFIGWVWTALIRPALAALVWFWQFVLAPALSWLYNTIVLPIFTLIGAAIRFVWEWVIRPVLQALVWFWQNVLAPALSWLYNTIIKPLWDAVGATIRWVWDNVIRPAFDAVKGGLDFLGEKFTDTVEWIKDIWARMKGHLAKPINFMIDVVWNKGVVPAWNKVAELVGIGKIDPLPLIPEARTGGRVDSTGRIHGPGTGTSDSIWGRVIENDAPIKVSAREMIMNARATRENYPVLAAMNGGGRIGDRSNERRAGFVPVASFAGGGAVWQGLWDTVRRQFPRARLTDANSPRPGYHGKGQAIDVAGSFPMAVGQMKEINHWIGNTFPGSTQLIHYPLTGGGINLLNGGPHNYGLKTQFEHQNHVHWAQDPAQPRGGGNGARNGWEQVSTYFMDAAREAFDTLTNPALGALKGLVGEPPPVWRDVIPKMATKIRDTARDFVFGKAKEKDAQASSGGDAMMGPVGDGEIFVIQQIADSARARGLGFEGASIGVATGIVESGLRNLNYGDRDSLGVFQQRPSMGWGSPAQIMNVRYAADKFFNGLMGFNWRAMDPGMAAQKVQRSAFPDKYGKVMGRARDLVRLHGGTFDAGGYALGKGLMFKDVIAPEVMLDPVETEYGYRPLASLARQLEADRFQAPAGLSPQQIADMATTHPRFPTEFELVGGELELTGDGIARIVDGRLRAVTQHVRTGRDA
ncbi:hypothetical protein GCM10009613_61270 [Pseudonocardia kongjuensis]|uniref:Tape measure protein n=1 Tax=Pseudonocardia kongjuensis TaxID=102227 RepID=A0ABN1YF08_9PSEU